MRRLAYITAAAVMLVGTLAAQEKHVDPRLLFLKGNEALDRQAFDEAVDAYQKALASGGATGEVHFNLANALVRAGKIGPAILHYRLAQAALPRDPEVQWNLGIAREMVVDKTNRADPPAFLKTLLFFHWSLTLGEARSVFLGLFLAGFALLHLWIFVRRTWLTRLVAVVLALALLAGASILIRTVIAPPARQAVVLPESVVVRSGPSADYAQTFELHEGVELRIDEERSGWLKIDVDGRKGWVAAAALGLLE